MLENQQEKQQQPKNDNGKRLFYVILLALAWVLFVFCLLMCSSKCAKAVDTYTTVATTGRQSSMITNNHNGIYKANNGKYYYGNQNANYEYNDSTGQWNRITLTGDCTYFNSNQLWLDTNNNVNYYSNGAGHYAINFNTYTCSTRVFTATMTGGGNLNFDGQYMFRVGNNYFNMNGTNAYQFNITSTDDSTRYFYSVTRQSFTGNAYGFYILYDFLSGSSWYLSSNPYSVTCGGSVTSGGYTFCRYLYMTSTTTKSYSIFGKDKLFFYNNKYYSINASTYYEITDLANSVYTGITSSDLPMELYSEFDSGFQYSYVNTSNSPNFFYTYYGNLYGLTSLSSGGYTQQDLDNAYAGGYSAGITYADGRVNVDSASYSAGHTAGVTDGENNVISDPNDYNLYTSTQYNNYGTQQYNSGYSAGQLDSDNYENGYQRGYADGEFDGAKGVVDYVASKTEWGATGNTYDNGVWSTDINIELTHIINYSKIEVLNEVSAHTGMGGSGTVYTSWSSVNLSHELDSIESYLINTSQLELLNYASGQHGSGTVYNSFTFISYSDELSLIYSNGAVDSINAGQVGYSGGYSAGINSVVSNPSYYDLYSKNDYESAVASARASGYTEGYHVGINTDSADLPSTIIAVASVPYVVLSSMFNFNVLGVNIFIFVTSLISLVVVIWLIKKIWK